MDTSRRHKQIFKNMHFNDNKKEALFSEMHSLLAAGIDFSYTFKLLIESESDNVIRRYIDKIYKSVVQGHLLWQAMEMSGQFSKLDCGVIKIGEESGRLDESLNFLAEYYKKRVEQRRMIVSAVSYPVIIICTAIIVVTFMLMAIVPMFEQVYQRMGGELPALTKWIISASEKLPMVGIMVFIIVVGSAIIVYAFGDSELFRKYKAEFLLSVPIVGDIIKKDNQAKFCRLLNLLLSSGVPLLNSIVMLEEVVIFYPYQKSFAEIVKSLHRGGSFSENLEQYNSIYDKKLITLVRVAEETNRLAYILKKQGEELTRDLEYKIKKLGTLLEPLLIIFVGILVTIILLSMYMPMFKLGAVVG